MFQEHSDAIAVTVGKTATYTGGASAFFFGLTANEVAAFGGLLVAVFGVCVQVYFGRRKDRRDAAYQASHDKREAEYHAARLMWREDDGED